MKMRNNFPPRETINDARRHKTIGKNASDFFATLDIVFINNSVGGQTYKNILKIYHLMASLLL